MAKFAYNNSKNASMSYTSIELNYGYHPWVSYKDKYDAFSKSSLVNKLAMELRKLMNICC